MSISQLLQPNSYSLYAKTVNDIQTEPIRIDNQNGQVLTIVDKDSKTVAFTNVPSDIPDTTGFPDGYVLKIIDNTTNEVNWEPDSIGGVVIPLVLTGDSPSAFQVRNTSLQPSLIVDTVNNAVQLTATDTRVEGADSVAKFGVYNNAETNVPEFRVDTVNHNVTIGGLGSAVPHNFNVKANNGNNVFNANTVGSVVINDPIQDNIFSINPALGQTELSTSDGSIVKQIVANNTAGLNKIELVAKDDATCELNATNTLKVNVGDITLNGNSGSTLKVGDGGNNVTTTSNFIIDGAASTDKFLVKDEVGNKIFWVETTSDSIFLGGSNSGAKWGVFDINFNLVYLLDTNGSIMRLSNAAVNSPIMIVNYNTATFSAEVRDNIRRAGMIAKSNTVGGGELRVQSGGATSNNIIHSTSSLGFDITSDNVMTINGGSQLTITSPCNFSTNSPTTSIVPTIDNSLTNKLYVDTKVGNLYVGTTDTANINNGSIVPTGLGTLMVPANAFNAGDSFHLVMSGDCTFNGGDTITITLLANAVVIGTIVIDTETTTPANPWELEGDFTIRSLGVSGSVAINFDFTYIGTNQNAFVGSRSVEVNTIDTTIGNMLGVNAVCSDGVDTIRTRLMYLKKMF